VKKLTYKVLYFFCFFFSAVTTLNVLRYMPYGGDAKIYCELTDYSQTSDVSIYNTTLKYTFNYPPIFENIFTRLCAFNYVDNYYFYTLTFGILFLILSKKQDKNIFLLHFIFFWILFRTEVVTQNW
jgi:hypothetical protein